MAAAERVALVAGGAETVGEAVGRELVRRGWRLLLQGTDEEDLATAGVRLNEIASEAGQVVTFPADLADEDDREALIEHVLDEFDRIDLLISAAAGPTVRESLLELDEQDYASVMSAYVTAPLLLIQLAANEMVRLTESGAVEAGKIILVNSICAYTSATERAARCIASAATAMLTRLFADALAEHGISVFEVRAGLISTGGTDAVHARYGELIEDGLTPIRRWGRPQDIALAVAAVAEDLLPYSTGEVINVDGGFHLRRL